MSARGSPLRGLLKLVSVSRSPGEIEKKGRRASQQMTRFNAGTGSNPDPLPNTL